MSRTPRDTDATFQSFKQGTLNSASANSGDIVTQHKQAIAIALAERDRQAGSPIHYGAKELKRQANEKKAYMLAQEIARKYGGKK